MDKKLEPIIVFENSDYLVLNKPTGLISHGGGNITEETLVDFLKEKYPEIKEVGDDPLRPGLVHRLDKEASGLMVVAKTNKAFENLKKQFKARKVTKKYIALAHGKISKDEDLINFPIKRSRDGFKMAALPIASETISEKNKIGNRDRGILKAQENSKEAITNFKVIKRFVNYSLLEVAIKTGRTHQIRVHLFAYGHPLLGDPLYFTKKTKVRNQKSGLNRLFLVSKELGFKDLTGAKQSYTIDLPKELDTFLQKLK